MERAEGLKRERDGNKLAKGMNMNRVIMGYIVQCCNCGF